MANSDAIRAIINAHIKTNRKQEIKNSVNGESKKGLVLLNFTVQNLLLNLIP